MLLKLTALGRTHAKDLPGGERGVAETHFSALERAFYLEISHSPILPPLFYFLPLPVAVSIAASIAASGCRLAGQNHPVL